MIVSSGIVPLQLSQWLEYAKHKKIFKVASGRDFSTCSEEDVHIQVKLTRILELSNGTIPSERRAQRSPKHMMPTLTKDTAITLNSGIKVSPSYWVENAHTYSLFPSPT